MYRQETRQEARHPTGSPVQCSTEQSSTERVPGDLDRQAGYVMHLRRDTPVKLIIHDWGVFVRNTESSWLKFSFCKEETLKYLCCQFDGEGFHTFKVMAGSSWQEGVQCRKVIDLTSQCHSRSKAMLPNERAHLFYYYYSIVIIGLSCTVFKIQPVKNMLKIRMTWFDLLGSL